MWNLLKWCFTLVYEQNGTTPWDWLTNNSVALVRERTISTERLPLVDEVSANLCGYRVVAADPLRPYSRISRPEPLLFLWSSSSIILTRLSWPCSWPTTLHKIWQCRESNLNFWIYSQELWPLNHRGGHNPFRSIENLKIRFNILSHLMQSSLILQFRKEYLNIRWR
jgi:hypothetical protein